MNEYVTLVAFHSQGKTGELGKKLVSIPHILTKCRLQQAWNLSSASAVKERRLVAHVTCFRWAVTCQSIVGTQPARNL